MCKHRLVSQVMSGVEHKKPGHFVDQEECTLKQSMLQPGDDDDDGSGWGVSMVKLGRDDLSYALGSQGSTRKKLSHASGCILEYLNYCAVAAGTAKERERASSYLKWLLMQRTGPVSESFTRWSSSFYLLAGSDRAELVGGGAGEGGVARPRRCDACEGAARVRGVHHGLARRVPARDGAQERHLLLHQRLRRQARSRVGGSAHLRVRV